MQNLRMTSLDLYLTIIMTLAIYGAMSQEINLTSSATEIFEHQNVTLMCSVPGNSSFWRYYSSSHTSIQVHIYYDSDTCIPTGYLSNSTLYDCQYYRNNTFALILINGTRKLHSQSWECKKTQFGTIWSNSVTIYVNVPLQGVVMNTSDWAEGHGVTISEDQTIELTCNTSYSRPISTVIWYISKDTIREEIEMSGNVSNVNSTDEGGLLSTSSTLIFAALRQYNDWNISCEAKYQPTNRTFSDYTLLNITYNPDGNISIQSCRGSNYRVIEGKQGSLSCSITGGNPLPSLTWICNCSQLISTVEPLSDTVTSHITWSAMQNNSESFECRADQTTDNTWTTSMTCNVEVLYPPDIHQLSNRSVIEYTSFNYSCPLRQGKPQHTTVSWTSEGSRTWDTQLLSIHNISRSDEMEYNCTVFNTMNPTDGTETIGYQSRVFYLDVLYPPVVENLSNIDVIEGQSYRMACNYTRGQPPETSAMWIGHDGSSWDGPELSINHTTRNNSMHYTCSVNNTMEPTNLTAEYGRSNKTFYLNIVCMCDQADVIQFEMMEGNESVYEVTEGSAVRFICTIESNPSSNVTIQRRGQTLRGMTETKQLDYTYNVSSCLDAGEYICYGENAYNNGNPSAKTSKLLVKCTPMVDTEVELIERLTISQYDLATLRFIALAYPTPAFNWYKLNNDTATLLTSNDKLNISSSELRSNLTIEKVTLTDFGQYRLVINNSIGSREQLYTLDPFGRPDPPSLFSYLPQSLTETTVTVRWKPGFNGGPQQHFVLVYKKELHQEWVNKTFQDTGDAYMNYTVEGLASGVKYQFQLYAANTLGNSTSVNLYITTVSEGATVTTKPPSSITALLAGSAVSGVVVLAGIVIGVWFYRKRLRNTPWKPIYENVHFSGAKTRSNMPNHADIPTVNETSFDGLREIDDVAQSYTEPTEYCNAPEKIEKLQRIHVSELFSYVSDRNEGSFRTEFMKLPAGLEKPCTCARKPENIALNRYNGIYPYDHSRVQLQGHPDFFMNACYIDGYKRQNVYIASLDIQSNLCQAAIQGNHSMWLLSTGGCLIEVTCITKLHIGNLKTGCLMQVDCLIEVTTNTGLTGMKCEQYWPDQGIDILYGDVFVSCKSVDVFAEYAVRTFTMAIADENRSLTQLHFTAWPDKMVPEDVTSLIEFRLRLKATPKTLSGPIIVHCSAGIGRTGTLIALDRLIEEGQCEGSVDVFACVNSMREQRVKMVQTAEQYMYIYKALVNTLTYECTPIPFDTFAEFVGTTNDTIYRLQFQQLQQAVEIDTKEEREARTRNGAHLNKNRDGADIPGDQHRVRLYLNRGEFEDSDYINAVYINSFTRKNHFIIAQSPLPGHIQDFVCMIYQEGCSCVVTMEDLNKQEKRGGVYLPADNQTLICGDFTISCSRLKTRQHYIVRKIKLRQNGKSGDDEKIVYHIQYLKWTSVQDIPSDPAEFVQFVQEVEEYANQFGDESSPVIVHCLKANERSALFCALVTLMEKLKAERQVCVMNTLRHIRTRRRTAITSREQLKFCYQALNVSISTFAT